MTEPDLIDEFAQHIQNMTGKPCWSVQYSGIGSLANLHIGERITRDQPMLHQDFQISMEERVYQGEFILYLEECPWRLDGPEKVEASWMDTEDDSRRILEGLGLLQDRAIQKAELTRPGFDLCLHFDGDYALRIFPDQVDPETGDNYSLRVRDDTYVVAANSTLYIE